MAVVNLIKKKGVNPLTKQVIFFPQWTRRSTDTAMELAEQMDGSTYSQGEITGMLIDFPKRILRSLMNGNAAKIPGLGHLVEFLKALVAGNDKDILFILQQSGKLFPRLEGIFGVVFQFLTFLANTYCRQEQTHGKVVSSCVIHIIKYHIFLLNYLLIHHQLV